MEMIEGPDVEIRSLASQFEAKKIGMTQDKNGHILKLVIHPHEIPQDVIRDIVGTRYAVALVRIDDEDKPVASPLHEEGRRAIRLAGALCSDPDFQLWLTQQGHAEDVTEEAATVAMREMIGVASRKELQTNESARRKLAALRDTFADHYRRR